MAKATRRISVGSGVLATYRGNPVNSGGRLIAGVGSCCPSSEWGFPVQGDVAERFLEFIAVLKKLLSGGSVEFQGKIL